VFQAATLGTGPAVFNATDTTLIGLRYANAVSTGGEGGALVATQQIHRQHAVKGPTFLAALGHLRTDAVFGFLNVTTGTFVDTAATCRAHAAVVAAQQTVLTVFGVAHSVAAELGAVFRAGGQRLVAVALTVPAPDTFDAVHASQGLGLVNADAVPIRIAAIGVVGADARFNGFIGAAGGQVGVAAIAAAASAVVGLSRTAGVPRPGTA